MKRRTITLIIVIVSFLLQSTLFHKLSFGRVSPNLLLIVTVAIAFMRGPKAGMTVGIFCGFLMDFFWGTNLGFNMLLFTVIGYINGGFQRLFYDDDIIFPLALVAMSDFGLSIATYIGIHMLNGDFSFFYYLFHIMIPELVYTVIVTTVIYSILLRINKKLEVDERRSASKFV